jgi:DNA ligase (NAD+)
MEMLRNIGFNTVIDSGWDQFPQDGKVIRLLSNNKFQSLGYTDKHPRGAFALKEQQQGVITTLEDVIWQVGRTGVVSPVAILKPILIGAATISRATLNNIKYIKDLNLEIGCNVELIRSGEIIPRILRRVP